MEKLVLIALLVFCLSRIFIALITKEVDFSKTSRHGLTKKGAIWIIVLWTIFIWFPVDKSYNSPFNYVNNFSNMIKDYSSTTEGGIVVTVFFILVALFFYFYAKKSKLL